MRVGLKFQRPSCRALVKGLRIGQMGLGMIFFGGGIGCGSVAGSSTKSAGGKSLPSQAKFGRAAE